MSGRNCTVTGGASQEFCWAPVDPRTPIDVCDRHLRIIAGLQLQRHDMCAATLADGRACMGSIWESRRDALDAGEVLHNSPGWRTEPDAQRLHSARALNLAPETRAHPLRTLVNGSSR